MRTLRADVQVLRAIAVLSVLIFHFDLPWLNKGFLGVDIFFVISGFLMSRVIIESVDAGRFQAVAFYFRRARRLLPAAFAMLLLTTLAAPFMLTGSALKDYGWQLLGALSFSANIVLWLQSGYFDGAATLKPLLHTWSLALEEQYYFVLPLVLILAGRRARMPVLLSLTLGSVALCLWWNVGQPSASFYLLPSRAWELLLGSLCALPGMQAWTQGRQPRFDSGWLCLPAIAASLIWGLDAVHPRGDALLVALATAGLILWPSRLLDSPGWWMRPWTWIGDRSYSLYLVHWPLIVLARHVWLEGVPAAVSAGLLSASLGLAHLMYAWVELPFKRLETLSAFGRRLLWLLVPLAGAAAMLGHRLAQPEGQGWAQALQPNHGFGLACEYEPPFTPRADCRNAPQPRTLVWGDSYAMHLIPALQASAPPGGILQATRSVCTPLLDYARLMPDDPADRARRCLAFNQSVLDFAIHDPHIAYVVISSRWQYLFDDPVVNARGQPVQPSVADLASSLQRTIAILRQHGKKVILVAPPPQPGTGVNLGLCAERQAQGLLTMSPSLGADCSFDLNRARRHQADVRAVLESVQTHADVSVIDLADFHCPAGLCSAMVDGVPVYRDEGHLSRSGSAQLGQALQLGPRIAQQAR